MKKAYAVPLLMMVLLLAGSVYGSGGSNTGTTSLVSLKLSPSARGIALGDAYVGVSDDLGALFYNPSGMCSMGKRGEAGFTWLRHPAGATFGAGQIILPNYVGGGKLGMGLTLLTSDDIEETVPDMGKTGNKFRTSEWNAFCSYAMDFTDKFSAGMTFKYVYSCLDDMIGADATASTWCVDIGTTYRTDFHGLKMGMAITNFGSRPKYYAWENKLPMNFRVGTSLFLIKDVLLTSFEFNHPNDNIETYHVGIEYSVLKYLKLRSGFKYMEENYWYAGGLGINLLNQKLRVDYTYQSFNLYQYMANNYLTFSYIF